MMNDFDQIISSGGHSFTGTPSTSSSTARANHSSSTSTMPLPELKMMSMNRPPLNAFASQCANAISVLYPSRASTSSTR
jgi:hypothetical protein